MANRSERFWLGGFRLWRRTGMLASWPNFGGGIGGSNKVGVRRDQEKILPENSDGCCDVDRGRRPIGFAAHREAAHLAFDAALVAAVSARRHALLEDFSEDHIMQRRPVLRGEWRRRRPVCGGQRARHGGRTAGRDPYRHAAPLRWLPDVVSGRAGPVRAWRRSANRGPPCR